MKIVSNGKTLEVGGGSSSDVYSTEEQVIGTWIDGKPLYRKVFSGLKTPSSASTATSNLLSYNANIDNVISCRGILTATSMQRTSVPYYITATDRCYVAYNGPDHTVEKNSIRCCCGQSNVNNDITVFLEYTKTTDESVS